MGGLTALLVVLLVGVQHVVHADTNVTIDDTDTTDILYNPPSSWTESSFDPFDAGGTHMLTSDSDATATFTFTGTAIYFWAPLWPSRVSTALSLDGATPQLVDLRDFTQPFNPEGGPTVASAPVWSATGLEDTQHTLVMSVGAEQNVAVVDRLEYTLSDTDPLPSTSDTDTATPTATDITSPSSSSTSSSRTPLPTPTQTAAAASSSSNTPGLSIAIGIVVALFACIALGVLFWWWRRRRTRRRLRAEESALHPPLPEMGEMPPAQGASLGRTRSARYRDITAYFGGSDNANAAGSQQRAAASRSSRRNAPPPPVPRRKPPPPGKSSARRSLGTIPEVHPRDVLSDDENTFNVPSGAGTPEWADVRLVGGGVGGTEAGAALSDREDPWTIRTS